MPPGTSSLATGQSCFTYLAHAVSLLPSKSRHQKGVQRKRIMGLQTAARYRILHGHASLLHTHEGSKESITTMIVEGMALRCAPLETSFSIQEQDKGQECLSSARCSFGQSKT